MYSFLKASLLFVCKLSSIHLLWEEFPCCFPCPLFLFPPQLGENPCPEGRVHLLLSLLAPAPCFTVLCLTCWHPQYSLVQLAYPSLWSNRGEGFSVCVSQCHSCVPSVLGQLCRASWHTITCQLETLKERRDSIQRPPRNISKRRCQTM